MTSLKSKHVAICDLSSAFLLGGRRGTRTPQHFVNLTGESKNFGIPAKFYVAYVGNKDV
jgi:hypothetical protein